ncbi:gliding motility protein GldM [Flavobacterium alkalisoli]|uniref:Protein involved in gliding motility GldM n=2 Tax=Flavobacterium TaxID=237 RepID=A0A444W8R6_9FLAO|nr:MULTISPECIES: gliding motility protein GldM [Flavobacterium]QEE48200.1 gliding motility protein GldM [Flavobacterium alkalisoli]RYJ42008.1 Protein involved in gliding motility GldM [Flavobacterium beibuense]
MAGGKLTPRQKMINLMYLVFIAMLALNMSKEVLSAFGLMNEKFEDVNAFSKDYNNTLYADLQSKAKENASQYAEPFEKAKKVKPVTDAFYAYIESLKNDVTSSFERENGKLPYEAMDKGDMIDEKWFDGDGYSKKGQEIIATIEKYKSDLVSILGKSTEYKIIVQDINRKFDLGDVTDGEGVKKKYLDYHYKGFPAIASLTKLTAMQNDVKKTEQDIYNALVGNTTAAIASMNNYQAMVVTEKSAFFAGEPVKGTIVLGRYDESTVPTSVELNGSQVDLNKALKGGQVNFEFGAGNIGEHEIGGKFTFVENGKPVEIPIKGNYVVVPKPNSATISADKMNSVYRGVENPMTISFAGIPDSDVTASAPGLKKVGNGKYVWSLNGVSGREATVKVSGKLPGGQVVSDSKKFNIREIPAPSPKLRGKVGSAKGNKNDLSNSTIDIDFSDFVFDIKTNIKQFEVYVPGSPAIICQGNKFNAQALSAISKSSRGDQVIITNIKYDIIGAAGYTPKPSTAFNWEVQ